MVNFPGHYDTDSRKKSPAEAQKEAVGEPNELRGEPFYSFSAVFPGTRE
jgi:hypothetical protein